MKADLSRDTFDPAKHYAAVIQQQGRVQLDADWNEQAAIAHHHAETSLRDLVGPFGGPLGSAGFGVTVGHAADGTVDGLQLGAGNYYVDGVLCENTADVLFTAQPFLPGAALPAGQALLYLEVWRRVVTPLDDPSLHETALGEADTTVRLQTVWQAKAVPFDGTFTDDGLPANWPALTAALTGTMTAVASPQTDNQASADLLGYGVYQGLENQLYRVEVHVGGNLSTTVVKWSRDNGVVTTTVTALSGHTLTVHDLGRDAALGFAVGQWVEITTAANELAGTPGLLAKVADVDEASLQIVLDDGTDLTGFDVSQALRLRRWDGVFPPTEAARATVPLTEILLLEAGLFVSFVDGTFRPGDYWLIPARAANTSIEWPTGGAQSPHGVQRHFAPLAVVANANGVWQVLTDLRKFFPPLTATAAPPPKSFHLTAFALGDARTTAPRNTQTLYYDGLNFEFSDNISLDCLDDGAFEVVIDQQSTDVFSAVVRLHGTMTVSGNHVNWRPFGSPGRPLAATPVVASVDTAAVQRTAANPAGNPNIAAAIAAAPTTTNVAAGVALNLNPLALRVTLHGARIWAAGDGVPRRYLDGMALGRPGGGLVFPSGIGVAASDFGAFMMLAPAQAPKLG